MNTQEAVSVLQELERHCDAFIAILQDFVGEDE